MSDIAVKTAPSPAVSPHVVDPDADRRWPARLWGILVVACLVVFLDGLDVSMVGVALPSIGAELELSTTSLQWIVNGYILGFGGLLLLGGRTADLLGRHKVFLAALTVFAFASLLGGLVDNGPLLIATRLLKGMAAAFTAPTAMSIVTTTFAEGRARNRALSIFAVFGASGYSSGLIFGGLLTELGWRWTFIMPVPLAILAIVGGRLLIPRDRPAASGGYDVAGAATLTGGMLLAVYTVVSAPETGWLDATTLGSLALAGVLLAAFFAIERRVRHPLIRLGILRAGTIVRANLTVMALFGSYLSFQFLMTIYFQSELEWSPLRLALALVPAGIIVAAGSPLVGRLIDRFGSGPLVVASMTSMVAGYAMFLAVGGVDDPVYAFNILPSVLLFGLGFALGFSSLMAQATSGVDDSEQGLASGLMQTSGQIGGAMVLAATTALVTSGQHAADAAGAGGFDQFRPSAVLIAGVAIAGLAVT
ncbi:MAG: MFS transporter, partial [Stackebrandtia sp.]